MTNKIDLTVVESKIKSPEKSSKIHHADQSEIGKKVFVATVAGFHSNTAVMVYFCVHGTKYSKLFISCHNCQVFVVNSVYKH